LRIEEGEQENINSLNNGIHPLSSTDRIIERRFRMVEPLKAKKAFERSKDTPCRLRGRGSQNPNQGSAHRPFV
jgi:hypothetical protein